MPNPDPESVTAPPVLTPSDLASRWHVSPRTVRDLIARGDLPAMQIGKQWRVSATDMLSYEQRFRDRSAEVAP